MRGTRRGAATTRHETERLGRWLAPRTTRGGRAVARALLFGLLWTALGLALIVQAVRVYAPPLALAIARQGQRAIASGRAWLDANGARRERHLVEPEQELEAMPEPAHARRYAA